MRTIVRAAALSLSHYRLSTPMTGLTQDTRLIEDAFAYVVEVYRELSEENGAPSLGTQNQAVDFVLADPEMRRSVGEWARHAGIDEATTAPRQRVPYDETYQKVSSYLRRIMETPVFEREDRH
jgi:hypothetical protein